MYVISHWIFEKKIVKIWDSNDASIDAAQQAVDHFEQAYTTFKSLICRGAQSAHHTFEAAKVSAGGIEHHLLVPVRDFVILPTFHTVENVARHISPDRMLALHQDHVLPLVRSTPLVGESILAPALNKSVDVVQFWWHVVQYPIPRRESVSNVTDNFMTATKFCLRHVSREVYFYTQLFDQTLTRTLMHTQWRVLGVGPYANLNQEHRKELIDYMCQRYFEIEEMLARYEFIVHIKRSNYVLYFDLVGTGLLLERSQLLNNDYGICQDIWLKNVLSKGLQLNRSDLFDENKYPSYFDKEDAFLQVSSLEEKNIIPLWFFQSGDKTGSKSNIGKDDVAWYQFSFQDGKSLEEGHDQIIRKTKRQKHTSSPSSIMTDSSGLESLHEKSARVSSTSTDKNLSEWYNPSFDDVIVDESRHAVSFEERNMIMRPILWRFYGCGRKVRRGVWLLEQDNKEKRLLPYSDESSAILEDAYFFLKWYLSKKSSCEGKGNIPIDSTSALLTIQIVGPDGEDQLVQFRSLSQVLAVPKSLGGGLSLFKKRIFRGVNSRDRSCDIDSTPSLAAPFEYCNIIEKPFDGIDKSEGCDHLVLVVHGIGEMMKSVDVFGLNLPNLSSIVDCCAFMRNNHMSLCRESSDLKNLLGVSSECKGRIEYLPVEWHEKFNHLSRRSKSNDGYRAALADITLNTVPGYRALANDTLLDVLYFMEPTYHKLLIDVVTTECNLVVEKARTYLGRDLKVSIIGHSLGSIITWDILSHQTPTHILKKPTSRNLVLRRNPVSYLKLNFEPTCLFMLGAPMAVFLLIRNQHQRIDLDYKLPTCSRVYNVFHPYDPVAYRLEPLLDPRNSEIEPEIIPHWKGGYRMQYQTKLMWKNFVHQTHQRQQIFVDALEAGIRNIFDDEEDDECTDDSSAVSSKGSEKSTKYIQCGQLNGGRRIDYTLQESEVETANEYVFALGSHSAYWSTKDLAMFIGKEIFISSMNFCFDSSVHEKNLHDREVYVNDSEDELMSPLPDWEAF